MIDDTPLSRLGFRTEKSVPFLFASPPQFSLCSARLAKVYIVSFRSPEITNTNY